MTGATCRGVVVAVDGTATGCDLDIVDGADTLDALRTHLGCDWVERIQIGTVPDSGLVLDVWLDEEGSFGKPPNPVLEALLAELRGPLNQRLFGTAVFCASDPDTGSTASLPGHAVDHLLLLSGALSRRLDDEFNGPSAGDAA